ncbi:MAG: thioredoxin [Ignavibacteria bacterium RBG_13_36_8]|nr:MAG: thioredoxin [Ignavibacteria bacterium RBG_13_36_8]
MTIKAKVHLIVQRLLTVLLLLTLFTNGCEAQSGKEIKESKESSKAKVTFIELGSVKCIPCKMMQPIMKNIEKNYGAQVKVTFYDVWTQEQRKFAEYYKIRVIPTQVFLDENGKEFHRHEGFYPEEEIDKILQGKGLNPIEHEN